MKRTSAFLALLAALLLVVACGPAARDDAPGADADVPAREDVNVLVYASPL